jgi:tetratricopeptide (TPR) repeat protein
LAESSWCGVGKPKRSGSGFSAAKQTAAPKQQITKSSADHAAKEQQAVALIDQGKPQEAEAIYRELIAAGTRNHIVYGNLGAICGMQGRFDELVELLRKTLQLKPNYPDAHNNLGVALKEQGDLDAAIASYNTALQLNPNYPDAHNNLGNTLKEQGDLGAAIASYNTALQLNPNYPDAHNNLGNTLKEQGDLGAAIASYNTALQLKPNIPEVHYNLGVALQEQGDLDAAIASYNTALQLKPNYPDAHNNLGNTLQEQGDLDAAIASYNTALQLKPNYPDAHNNLGVAFQEQGDLDAAIASYNTALQLKPNYPDAHNNLGNALQEQGDLDAAIASYNTALELEPNIPEANNNLSMAEMQVGDYKTGWARYESRFQCKKNESMLDANPSCRQWSGEEQIEGIQILLVSEQGLGDTLQFMRYATILRAQGASISLCAPPKLHTLIQASGIDPLPLTPKQANHVTDGHWIPLLSIPRHLEVNPGNPIITEPYIKTTNELASKWSGILSSEKRPIIGINWQGNPSHEKANSKGRSLPLETFAPIAQLTNISLLSLQKGFGSEQLENCSFKDRFVSCQPQVDETWDFLETSAIIANCDVVITSDTAVAHLAGGMGKTTWLLLKKVPEWR